MPKGLAILLALAFLAAGCFGGGSGSSASEGESLVLLQSDVGDEFTQFDKGSQRLSDLTPPRDDVDRFGRSGGWKARFSRPGTRTTDGPLLISSLADLFDSEDGARKDFALYEQTLGLFVDTGGREVAVAEPLVGDQFSAVTYQQGLAPNATQFYVVAWRTGNVTASLTVNGFKLTWEQVVALLNKQDQRIRAAQ